jgi:protein pelota
LKIEELIEDKGYIKVIIENEDDLWIISLIIEENDLVRMKTLRDVSIEGSAKKRLPMTLTIRVKHMEFQPFSGRLRIRGVIEEGPEEYGLKGSFHTFSVDIGSRLEILKKDGFIDRRIIDRFLELTNRGRRAILVALDYDSYCISLLQGQGLRILSESNFPTISKRDIDSYNDFEKKLRDLAKELIEYVKLYDPVAVVIGSPGDLSKKLSDMLDLGGVKVYRDKVSIGGCEGVQELIRRDVVRKILERYSEIRGEEILEEYMYILARDPERVLSGLDNLYKLVILMPNAIEKLVLIDSFMRADKETRDKITKIILNTLTGRGELVIVSDESFLGDKLRRLGGVIAILRYRVDLSSLVLK